MNLKVSIPRAASEPHVELLRGSPRPTDARAFRYGGEYSPRQSTFRKRNSITYSPNFLKRDPSYQQELTQSLQQTIRRQILSLEDYRTQVSRYQQDLDRSRKQNRDLSEQLRRLHHRRDESDSLRKLLQIEKDRARDTIQKMSRSHVSEHRDLLKEKNELDLLYRSLENRYHESEDLNTRQAQVIGERDREIALLRKELAAMKKENGRLNEETERLIESKDRQSELLESQRVESDSLRKSLDEEKNTSNSIEQKLFHVETELRLTKKDLDRVNKELVEKENRIEELEDDLENKSNLYISANSAQDSLKKRLQALEIESEEFAAAKEKIIQELQGKLSSTGNASEKELLELQDQVAELKDTIRDQEVLLEEADFSKQDAVRKTTQVNDLLEVYKVKLEAEKSRVGALTNTIKQQELMLMETMGNLQTTAISSQAQVEEIEELQMLERKLSNRLDAFRDLEESLAE